MEQLTLQLHLLNMKLRLLLLCFVSCFLSGCVTYGFSYTNEDVAGHEMTVALTKSGKEPVDIYVNATKHATK